MSPATPDVCQGHSFQRYAGPRNLYCLIFTFSDLLLVVLEFLGELLMFLRDLVDLILKLHDLPCVLQHVFLHLVYDDIVLNIITIFDVGQFMDLFDAVWDKRYRLLMVDLCSMIKFSSWLLS